MIDALIPIFEGDLSAQVGTMRYRSRYVESQMIFAEITRSGVTALVPCRRLNRITDPCGVYILADGSLWMSTTESPHAPVVAELIRAQEGSS